MNFSKRKQIPQKTHKSKQVAIPLNNNNIKRPKNPKTHAKSQPLQNSNSLQQNTIIPTAENTLSQIQHNWNNRKPYSIQRKQRKKLNRNIIKTEFKLILNEHQMELCYDPLKLYQLSKELMDSNIGTARVEGIHT